MRLEYECWTGEENNRQGQMSILQLKRFLMKCYREAIPLIFINRNAIPSISMYMIHIMGQGRVCMGRGENWRLLLMWWVLISKNHQAYNRRIT